MISGENNFIPSLSADIDSQFDLDIPITHCKRKRSYILHTMYIFLCYAQIFTRYRVFVSTIDCHPIPKFVSDTMSNLSWRVAMKDKMHSLEQNKT